MTSIFTTISKKEAIILFKQLNQTKGHCKSALTFLNMQEKLFASLYCLNYVNLTCKKVHIKFTLTLYRVCFFFNLNFLI